MTKASPKRVAKRTQKRTTTPNRSGGNGAAAPGSGSVELKPAEKARIKKAQDEILDLLAQKGNLAVEIEAAEERSRNITAAIVQRRKDFRDIMRSAVIAHGLDADRKGGQWNIDVDRDVIEFVRAQVPGRAAAAPPAPPEAPKPEQQEPAADA